MQNLNVLRLNTLSDKQNGVSMPRHPLAGDYPGADIHSSARIETVFDYERSPFAHGQIQAGRSRLRIGRGVLIGENVFVGPNTRAIDTGSSIGERSTFEGNGGEIGAGCSVGAWNKIGQAVVFGQGVRTGRRCDIRGGCDLRNGVALGDDVTLEEDVLVLPGVNMGRGSTAKRGAIVRKDVAPGGIVYARQKRITVSMVPSDILRHSKSCALGLAILALLPFSFELGTDSDTVDWPQMEAEERRVLRAQFFRARDLAEEIATRPGNHPTILALADALTLSDRFEAHIRAIGDEAERIEKERDTQENELPKVRARAIAHALAPREFDTAVRELDDRFAGRRRNPKTL
jgi:acetyltransferase-like isoleucine patch superfamily enzyme